MCCLLLAGHLCAQPRVSWGITAMTEGDWNMTDGQTAWVNYLEAGVNVGLWKGAQLEAAAIATYAAGGAVEGSQLGVSNIYADANKPFRLIQASVGQRIADKAYCAAGLRNIDVDYFTSHSTAFFTGPANANFPIISNNYPAATFPMSALGVHVELYPLKGITLKASVYNGVAYETLDRQFRFVPSSDGVFSIGSVSYDREAGGEHPAHYTLGYVCGKVPDGGETLVRKTGFWGLVEQPFLQWSDTQWCLLLQGAAMSRHTSGTHGYWGAGITVDGISRRKMTAGIAFNRMHDHAEGNELDIELTWAVPLTERFSLQPALHFMRSGHRETVVGLLRASLSLGNM